MAQTGFTAVTPYPPLRRGIVAYHTPLSNHRAAEACDRFVAAQVEQLRDRLSTRLNNHLVEMQSGYDDSIVGFNEAWDIVSKTFDSANPSLKGEGETG